MLRLLRRMKRLVKMLQGRDFFVKPEMQCKTVRLGGDYGGWVVAENYINNMSIVYSFGIGEDISFDLGLIKKYDVTINAFDPTPRSIEWVESQQVPSNFKLHKYGLADFNGLIDFHPPLNSEHISHTIIDGVNNDNNSISVEVKSIRTIMMELGDNNIDLLKMDIEGAEYDVIKNLSLSGIRPRQILIEFHHRFHSIGVEKTKVALSELSKMGYKLFSVSDSGEEYSFLLDEK